MGSRVKSLSYSVVPFTQESRLGAVSSFLPPLLKFRYLILFRRSVYVPSISFIIKSASKSYYHQVNFALVTFQDDQGNNIIRKEAQQVAHGLPSLRKGFLPHPKEDMLFMRIPS